MNSIIFIPLYLRFLGTSFDLLPHKNFSGIGHVFFFSDNNITTFFAHTGGPYALMFCSPPSNWEALLCIHYYCSSLCALVMLKEVH